MCMDQLATEAEAKTTLHAWPNSHEGERWHLKEIILIFVSGREKLIRFHFGIGLDL